MGVIWCLKLYSHAAAITATSPSTSGEETTAVASTEVAVAATETVTQNPEMASEASQTAAAQVEAAVQSSGRFQTTNHSRQMHFWMLVRL